MAPSFKSAEREAGRELDAIVAERVMGATWRKPTRYAGIDGVSSLVLGERHSAVAITFAHRWPDDRLSYTGPAYSSDIAAAMQVVEAMRAKGYGFSLTDNQGERWTAEFLNYLAFADAGTPALAICRAALKAIDKPHPLQSAAPPSDDPQGITHE